MHGADRHVTVSRFNILVQNFERQPGVLDGRTSPIAFHRGTDEHAHFVRHHAIAATVQKPRTDHLAFVFETFENPTGGYRPVEYRDCADSLFGGTVGIR